MASNSNNTGQTGRTGTGARIVQTGRQIADKATGGQRGSGITKSGGKR